MSQSSLATVILLTITLVCGVASRTFAQAAADKPHDVVVVEPGKGAVSTDDAIQVPAVVADRPLALLEPEGKRIYHGVCINAEKAEVFPERFAKYTDIAGGHKPSVVVYFAHAFDTEKPYDWVDYHLKVMQTIDKQGAIPFMKATTQTWANKELYFKADDILAGKHDAFFIRAAEACKMFGKPMFLSWNHEMNGDWYSYSEVKKSYPNSDWTAEKYIQFHRRVYKIFKDQGVTNVAFSFAPSIAGRKLGKFDEHNSWRAYYPGDEFVDWMAPSYYNHERPDELDSIASQTNKPIFVSEWGSSAQREKWYRPQPYPGNGAWMERTMKMWMHRYPNLKGSAYYQWEAGYQLQRDPKQVVPYVEALKDPMFIHGPLGTAAK